MRPGEKKLFSVLKHFLQFYLSKKHWNQTQAHPIVNQPPASQCAFAGPSPRQPLCRADAPSTEFAAKLHIQATHQFDLVLSTHKFKQNCLWKRTQQLRYTYICTTLWCTSNILVIHYYSSGSPPSSYTTHNT